MVCVLCLFSDVLVMPDGSYELCLDCVSAWHRQPQEAIESNSNVSDIVP
jgi:hypothetical protein